MNKNIMTSKIKSFIGKYTDDTIFILNIFQLCRNNEYIYSTICYIENNKFIQTSPIIEKERILISNKKYINICRTLTGSIYIFSNDREESVNNNSFTNKYIFQLCKNNNFENKIKNFYSNPIYKNIDESTCEIIRKNKDNSIVNKTLMFRDGNKLYETKPIEHTCIININKLRLIICLSNNHYCYIFSGVAGVQNIILE